MAGTMKCFICEGKGCVFCKNTGYIKADDPRMPAIIAYQSVSAKVAKDAIEQAAALKAEHEKNKAAALAKLTPEELAALGITKVE